MARQRSVTPSSPWPATDLGRRAVDGRGEEKKGEEDERRRKKRRGEEKEEARSVSWACAYDPQAGGSRAPHSPRAPPHNRPPALRVANPSRLLARRPRLPSPRLPPAPISILLAEVAPAFSCSRRIIAHR
uniref:Uncharacterized protein n=1 Tax=Oryza meridionalis TaxID=40149 RepID=A0A0E0C2N9_9ORYZ